MRTTRTLLHRFGVGLILASIVLSPVETDASSQVELSLNRMVDLSQEIVVGRVAGIETSWSGRVIVSVATVEVQEAIVGDGVPSMLRITQLGGSAIHPETGLAVTMTASSEVALAEGEQVLLFVSRTPTGLRQIVGGPQGKYAVRIDERTQSRTLPVAPKQLVVVRGAAEDVVQSEPMTLDEMRSRIRTQFDQLAKRPGGR